MDAAARGGGGVAGLDEDLGCNHLQWIQNGATLPHIVGEGFVGLEA